MLYNPALRLPIVAIGTMVKATVAELPRATAGLGVADGPE